MESVTEHQAFCYTNMPCIFMSAVTGHWKCSKDEMTLSQLRILKLSLYFLGVQVEWLSDHASRKMRLYLLILERQSRTEISRVLRALLDNMWMIASDMSIEVTSLA